MTGIRTFRNTDPPRLVEIWNEAFPGRGAAPLRSNTPLEQYVFAKPVFDPAGLFIAEEAGQVVGFGHAVRSQARDTSAPLGVICGLGVRPAFRRRGIGTQLLKRCEDYLVRKGASLFQAGASWPHNPFYLGIYGGSDSPGFLRSDPLAEPFFLARGYAPGQHFVVLDKVLDEPIKIVDARFAALRSRYDIRGSVPRSLKGFWNECILGFIEPIELYVVDQTTSQTVARTLVWEMEAYVRRWNGPAIGILRFEVDAAYRRQGLGKMLLSHLLRQVREQYFQFAEVHVEDGNDHAIRFLKSLDFAEVDEGRVYRKQA